MVVQFTHKATGTLMAMGMCIANERGHFPTRRDSLQAVLVDYVASTVDTFNKNSLARFVVAQTTIDDPMEFAKIKHLFMEQNLKEHSDVLTVIKEVLPLMIDAKNFDI